MFEGRNYKIYIMNLRKPQFTKFLGNLFKSRKELKKKLIKVLNTCFKKFLEDLIEVNKEYLIEKVI